MGNRGAVTLLVLVQMWVSAAGATSLNPFTRTKLKAVPPNMVREVLVHFGGKPDLSAFRHSRDQKRFTVESRIQKVVTLLKDFNRQQVAPVLEFLKTVSPNDVMEMSPIWITNSLRLRATNAVIQRVIALGLGESVVLEQPSQPEELADRGVPWAFEPHWQPEIGWGVRKIGAPEVWEIGARGQGVRVAVIDTGANVEHPDLAPVLWTNAGEQGRDAHGADKATNQIDDDNNGYVDDVHGFNFEERNGDLTDLEGHGTKSAGVIGGTGASGVATGVAPRAELMILRTCCDSEQALFESHSWEAMQYAMENGARVVSMSLTVKPNGKPTYDRWRRAGEALLAANIVHVNSAGNLGSRRPPNNIGAPASNPPAWFHPGQTQGTRTSMIAVGAVDQGDRVRSYSSTGPVTWEKVIGFQDFPYDRGSKPGLIKPEVCAPSEVPSLDRTGNKYVNSFGGTSSATPHVAGAAALLFSIDRSLTVANITEALEQTAVTQEKDYNNRCGSGRIDVLAAVKYALDKFPSR